MAAAWGNSIALTGERVAQRALKPRHGGRIVQQVALVDSAVGPHLYRQSAGFVLEVTKYCVVVSFWETPNAIVRTIDVEEVAAAGDDWADETEIRLRSVADLDAELQRREANAAAEADAEFDRAFAGAQTLGELLTGACRRSYVAVIGREERSECLLSKAEIDALAACAEAV